MKSSVTNLVITLGLIALGVAIGVAGIYIGDTDDAPGASLLGILLMIGAVALGVRIARRKTRHP
jgi:tetrahydromethanopterin S-methyltransferase subunit C